jgi:hypothetical protein
VRFVLSSAGQAILREAGFLVPAHPAFAGNAPRLSAP